MLAACRGDVRQGNSRVLYASGGLALASRCARHRIARLIPTSGGASHASATVKLASRSVWDTSRRLPDPSEAVWGEARSLAEASRGLDHVALRPAGRLSP